MECLRTHALTQGVSLPLKRSLQFLPLSLSLSLSHTHTHTHKHTQSKCQFPEEEIITDFCFFLFWFHGKACGILVPLTSVQLSSVVQSCLILCDPMNRSTPGLPVHHLLLEFTQTTRNQIHAACRSTES